jgi:hypothetical protein
MADRNSDVEARSKNEDGILVARGDDLMDAPLNGRPSR